MTVDYRDPWSREAIAERRKGVVDAAKDARAAYAKQARAARKRLHELGEGRLVALGHLEAAVRVLLDPGADPMRAIDKIRLAAKAIRAKIEPLPECAPQQACAQLTMSGTDRGAKCVT